MTPIQLVGKPAEVRKQFDDLALPEDKNICLTVAEETREQEGQRKHDEWMREMEAKYANHPRHNGVLLFSMPGPSTPDEVAEALYRMDMEEAFGENWEEVAKQMEDAERAAQAEKKAEASKS